MTRKVIGLIACWGLAVAAFAADAPVKLKSGHPGSYTVQRGDTLWGIAARFLDKPWLWPELWQVNPQVQDPHRIYPGDVLTLETSFASPEPHLRLEPGVRTEAAPIPAIPLDELKTFLKDVRVEDIDTVKHAAYVVALEQQHLGSSVGEKLYVRGLKTQPGKMWAIVRPTNMIRGFDDRSGSYTSRKAHELEADSRMSQSAWREDAREDGHLLRGHEMGVELDVVGTAETLAGGDPASLLLESSTREIVAGDRVIPIDDTPYDPVYYPHPARTPVQGAQVIALSDALAAVGRNQVVAVSIGSLDGVDNGQTWAIFHPGVKVHDPVKGGTVTLPREFAGHLMIFRTFAHVSYALVMDGTTPVTLNDYLQPPE
ncbi:LysM peptidoglycan-binding domain-containing protein [Frateuria aurantia]